MARLPETFNFGDTSEMSVEDLVVRIQRMYCDLAEAVNAKPDLYQRETDGQADETFLAQGSININLLTDKVEMLTNHQAATVTWKTL